MKGVGLPIRRCVPDCCWFVAAAAVRGTDIDLARNRANAETAGAMLRPVLVIIAMSRAMLGFSAVADIFIAPGAGPGIGRQHGDAQACFHHRQRSRNLGNFVGGNQPDLSGLKAYFDQQPDAAVACQRDQRQAFELAPVDRPLVCQ